MSLGKYLVCDILKWHTWFYITKYQRECVGCKLTQRKKECYECGNNKWEDI